MLYVWGSQFVLIFKLVQEFQYPKFKFFSVSPFIKKILVNEVGKMSFKGLGSCDVNEK